LREEPKIGIGNLVQQACRIGAEFLAGAEQDRPKLTGRRPAIDGCGVWIIRGGVLAVAFECKLNWRAEFTVVPSLHQRTHVGKISWIAAHEVSATSTARLYCGALACLFHHRLHPVRKAARGGSKLLVFGDQRFCQVGIQVMQWPQNAE
jgi:hypothetical protein